MDYNDLQFHIVGHYVKCSTEYMQSQLIMYMQTYLKGVSIVGKKLLAAKGLAVEDFIVHISQPNRGDELSLYLLARIIQKHLCVIRKNLVWYTSYCEDQQITVADCQIVIVYLWSGTVRDTKLIQTTGKGSLGTKLPLSSGEEYSPLPKSKVYNLAVKKW